MPDWLPRIPLALVACAQAVLIPGHAGRCCSEPLRWPALDWSLPWRAAEPVSLRAPAR